MANASTIDAAELPSEEMMGHAGGLVKPYG